MALTVRLPGAKIAPTSNTWACAQTGEEKSGANEDNTIIISSGRGNMALSFEWMMNRSVHFHLYKDTILSPAKLKMDKVQLKSYSIIFQKMFWNKRNNEKTKRRNNALPLLRIENDETTLLHSERSPGEAGDREAMIIFFLTIRSRIAAYNNE